MAKDVTDDNFLDAISTGLVIVDFWADWCAPCHALSPMLEQLDEETGDKTTVLKLNVDENPKTAQAHQIMSIPTVKFFKDGKEVDMLIGVQPKHVYEEVIKDNI